MLMVIKGISFKLGRRKMEMKTRGLYNILKPSFLLYLTSGYTLKIVNYVHTTPTASVYEIY